MSPIIEAAEIFNRPDYKEKANIVLDYYINNYKERIVHFTLFSHFYIFSAHFHVKFENIHLFVDGNDGTGHLATNYFLVTCNHPSIVIYEEDRIDYYAALEFWNTTQDLESVLIAEA